MKNNSVKIFIGILCSASLSFSVFSCSNSPTSSNTSTSSTDRQVGSKVDGAYVIDFLPQFVAGMRLNYVTKSKVGAVDMSQLTTIEVTETSSTTAKLNVTSGGKTNPVTFDRAKPPILPEAGITYEGRENVTVPAGTYNAVKVSFSNTTSVFNAWLSKDVGIVKVVEQRKEGLVVTTELNEFKK